MSTFGAQFPPNKPSSPLEKLGNVELKMRLKFPEKFAIR